MIKIKTKYIFICTTFTPMNNPQLVSLWYWEVVGEITIFYIYICINYQGKKLIFFSLFLTFVNVSRQSNYHAKCGKENKSFSALCRKSHVFIWPYFISTFSAHPLSNSRNVQRTYKKQPAGFVNLFDSAQHTTRIWRSIINYSQKSE